MQGAQAHFFFSRNCGYLGINSSSVSKFEDPFHRKIQNLTMNSIFNVDDDGMKEICIYSFSAENSGKVWFFA